MSGIPGEGPALTEEQLLQAYAATGTPVAIHTALLDALAQLGVIRQELADIRELVETVLGVAAGEVQVFRGEVKLVDLGLSPCPSCGWIASHDDDCPIGRSVPGAGL